MNGDCRLSEDEFEYMNFLSLSFSTFDINGDRMLNLEEFELYVSVLDEYEYEYDYEIGIGTGIGTELIGKAGDCHLYDWYAGDYGHSTEVTFIQMKFIDHDLNGDCMISKDEFESKNKFLFSFSSFDHDDDGTMNYNEFELYYGAYEDFENMDFNIGTYPGTGIGGTGEGLPIVPFSASGLDSEAETETETETETQTGTETETQTETQTGTETGMETETGKDSATQTGTGSIEGLPLGTGTDDGTEVGTGTEIDTVIATGGLCNSNDTCDEGGMCLTHCCSPWMTDNNCHSCASNGWCARCFDGCKWSNETGCAAPSPTLGRCHGVGTGPGIATGESCNSNDTCKGGAKCLSHCCSPLMTDNNCHSCASTGWCARCFDGCQWSNETGCAAPNPDTGNCMESVQHDHDPFNDLDLNEDGYVSATEFWQHIVNEDLDNRYDFDTIKIAVEGCDADGDKILDEDEFSDAYALSFVCDKETEYRYVFSNIDEDHDKIITETEYDNFPGLIEPMGVFDGDENGSLNYEEFVQMVDDENLICSNFNFLPCYDINDYEYDYEYDGNITSGTGGGSSDGNSTNDSGNGDWVTDDDLGALVLENDTTGSSKDAV